MLWPELLWELKTKPDGRETGEAVGEGEERIPTSGQFVFLPPDFPEAQRGGVTRLTSHSSSGTGWGHSSCLGHPPPPSAGHSLNQDRSMLPSPTHSSLFGKHGLFIYKTACWKTEIWHSWFWP